MTDKIDGKKCRYWFRPNPSDYRRCALRGKDDNCDEINDCFIKELLGKLAQKDEECKRLKEENDRLRKRIVTIFDCLIKANRDVIVDTLWVDKITTLWDYIAQTLGIEGDQNQIEEQVEMLYSEGE